MGFSWGNFGQMLEKPKLLAMESLLAAVMQMVLIVFGSCEIPMIRFSTLGANECDESCERSGVCGSPFSISAIPEFHQLGRVASATKDNWADPLEEFFSSPPCYASL
jgi:hypothetical protein